MGEDDHTQFHGVTYLGSASVNAPRSETEITRNMIILNEQSQMAIPVTLLVPSTSEGICRYTGPYIGLVLHLVYVSFFYIESIIIILNSAFPNIALF